MKTIIIIENKSQELEVLATLFKRWKKNITILSATDEHAAMAILTERQVDLVISDLTLSKTNSLKNFSILTQSFPYVPCITLSDPHSPREEEILKKGASHCLIKPVDERQLLHHAEELLEVEARGTVKGIPIHSFLQMLESENKTCTLEVRRKNDTGFLYIKNGTLVDAETKNFKGEKAAQLILSWKETLVKLRHFNGQRKLQIKKPLISIIMEAFQLKSAQEALDNNERYGQKHQLPLRHLSTLGKPIPLGIGSTVKLKFPGLHSLVEAAVVGMIPEQCILVSNPEPFSEFELLVGSPERIIVKYIDKGRAWMFKSQLLKCVDAPSPLLIFEYPGVIHYHELRKTKRSSIFVPSTFHLEAEKEIYGALIDLSTTGSLCQIKHRTESDLPQIDINSPVLLRCLLPGIKEEQKINGRVRNIKTAEKETLVGVEFENLQPHLADTIGKYIYSLENLNS